MKSLNLTNLPVNQHLPCPCGKSSDAYTLYDDGHGWCFSCSSYHNPKEVSIETGLTYEFMGWRGVSKEIMEKYRIVMNIKDGVPHHITFPYTKGFKNREISRKNFWSSGDMSSPGLFGKETHPVGSARWITITEGELDAASACQMSGGYPAVSVRSSSSAKADCLADFEYLNSFEKVYIAFDSDEQGQKATHQVAGLFDFNKVYHVKLGALKDANGYLEAGKSDEFKRIWWNSRRFMPENIISSNAEFAGIIDDDIRKESFPLPFEKLEGMVEGLQTGEVYLFTALEGRGKTEVLRAIEYSLLKKTDDNIGVIHLEESKARTLKSYAGYELQQPVHKRDSLVSKEEIKKVLFNLLKREDRLHIYSHYGSEDPEVILGAIRFMVGCGCKYVFLDHITAVVTGSVVEDERRSLDYIVTKLGLMTKELNFCLVMVSHVNDSDQTRGSRLISKVASVHVHMTRDVEHDDEDTRNTTRLVLKKNRDGALTGPAGELFFDLETFILADKKLPEVNQLPPV